MGVHVSSDGEVHIDDDGQAGGTREPKNWVDAYQATLRFIRSLAGLACFGWVTYLVVPHLGGFALWLSGVDKSFLLWMVGLPVAGLTLVAVFAIYAVFFRGTRFVEKIVTGQAASGRRGVTIDAQAEEKPPEG